MEEPKEAGSEFLLVKASTFSGQEIKIKFLKENNLHRRIQKNDIMKIMGVNLVFKKFLGYDCFHEAVLED